MIVASSARMRLNHTCFLDLNSEGKLVIVCIQYRGKKNGGLGGGGGGGRRKRKAQFPGFSTV